MINHVRNGTSKRTLLDKHGHVLGLNDVNLDIPAGEIQVIMGLSGSGKSTLIRHFNRLIEPTAGEIIVDGRNVIEMGKNELRDFRRFRASMVFQKFALLPHRTVTDNVAYGLIIQSSTKEEVHERSQKWIDRVGLTGFESYYPAQLSGGMQQRVGLARALATDAEILLMDEAFSALDPLIREEMQDVLLGLQEELKKTIVFITHDLDEALRIGDNISILRDGEIIQLGTPKEIITNPIDDFVREFTQGIPKAKVVDVAHILSAPKAVYSKSDSVDVVRRRMDHAQSDYAIGLGDEGQYLGIIGRAQLDIPSSNTPAELLDNTGRAIIPVGSSTTLQEALHLLSDNDLPLPVVDESNAFIGVVTQRDLLKMLASDI